MSQENVETFERGLPPTTGATSRRCWLRSLLPVLLGGEATVYRGHDGVRELMRELDESFPDLHRGLRSPEA